ncbi:hypothetical protein CGK32_22970, partial [Vibrio parahaemolyticus]|uniref:phage tail assembly chaperone n=1 Tax=Vibrio parahaemolyticus TaxID=670 RepID=UPI00116F634B
IQANKLKTPELLKFGKQLLKVALPALAEFMTQQQSGELEYAAIAELIIEGLDDVTEYELTYALLDGATVNHAEMNVDEYFRGDFKLLMEVLAWLVWENFGMQISDVMGSLQESFKQVEVGEDDE